VTRRVCPLCVVREAGLVSPDCVVCDGYGTLELGARALGFFKPEVVSMTIALALEGQARSMHTAQVRSTDPAPAMRQTLAQLAKAGMIVPPKRRAPAGPGATGSHPGPPEDVVARCTGITVTDTDHKMIRAHPYPYSPNDRPGVRGLPLFSNNWHPASLPCVFDPQPFHTTTTEQAIERAKRDHQARVLVAVLDYRSET
jgi:hypothetical protein